MRQYCDVHHGLWPATTDTTKKDSSGLYTKAWIYTIAPFMEDVDAIRICPDDMQGDDRMKNKMTTYALNGYLTSEAIPPFVNAWKLKASSKTIVMFELADRVPATDLSYDHLHTWEWFKKSNVLCREKFGTKSRGSCRWIGTEEAARVWAQTVCHCRQLQGVGPITCMRMAM